jgi:hypothetical protein
VKDKLRDGLKRDLRKEWAKVRPKPDSVVEQMAMIRDLGHADEDFDREEADRSRDQDRQSSRRQSSRRHESRRNESRRSDNSRPDKRRSEKREKNSSSSASRSGRERGSKSSGSSTYQQATRGVDSEVIAERRKNGDCLKCGKPGHSWNVK